MTDQPDNLEPWQRVAAELGTHDFERMLFEGEQSYASMEPAPDRHDGEWTRAAPACREIARLRAELQDRLDSQQTLEIAQLRAEVERLRAQVRPAAAAPELPAPAAGKPPAG